jgi:hypothetical protein
MPSLLGTGIAANYGRVVSTENYTETDGVRTYAGQLTQFGTRKLAFIVVELTDVHVNYTDSNSLLSQVVRALQQQVEVYGVGKPSNSDVTIIIADDTAPYDDGDEFADGNRNSRLEDALDAAGLSTNVWNAEVVGGDLNWD